VESVDMPYQTGFFRDGSGRVTFSSSGTAVAEHGLNRLSTGEVKFAIGTAGTWRSGFLRNASGDVLATTDATGASWQTGYLRHPSGALVITLIATKYETGFMRGPSGELSVSAVV